MSEVDQMVVDVRGDVLELPPSVLRLSTIAPGSHFHVYNHLLH